MGKIVDRLTTIAKRCGDLSPLAPSMRNRFWLGNRAAILSGTTPLGATVKPLSPGYLKRRRGSGPSLPTRERGLKRKWPYGDCLA